MSQKISHFPLDFVRKESVISVVAAEPMNRAAPRLLLPRQRRPASAGSCRCGAMVRRDPREEPRVTQPRSGTKSRSKAKRAKPIVHHNTRAKSKRAAVLALLS